MRDIKRIHPLLEDFGNIWEGYCPDWRFMQTICNFQRWLGSDGFYLEDDQLIEKFAEFIKLEIVKGWFTD